MILKKELKYITLVYDSDSRTLVLVGKGKEVIGRIGISYRYLYSLIVFINRIFRRRRWK